MLLLAFASFHRIICCSHASLESFPKFFRWLAGDRICAIQNGIDLDRVRRVTACLPTHSRNGNFTVAAVGRLIDIKNPLSVLRAFQLANNPSSHLVFIGDGPLRDLLTSQGEILGLGERIELTGMIPREKVYEYLVSADLFISASRGEGLPVAVLEAMACRKPVLLSDIPPHREIAQGTDFIPLVRPDDTTGFAQEIRKFIRMSRSERATIGEKCRKLVEERFTLTSMQKRYEEIYSQLAGRS
jgi:glycosyltransferase involved in cell wall biosynthesis